MPSLPGQSDLGCQLQFSTATDESCIPFRHQGVTIEHEWASPLTVLPLRLRTLNVVSARRFRSNIITDKVLQSNTNPARLRARGAIRQ
ncbi:MAG: hypothetical protein EAZ24_13545 [Burkholderiales bacterium]|nr:MAG: hypothetical protein EAZ24_13545 [Burkholderiales bacterium]TAG82773.1 MAG: hypothetical protein EAZ21_02765 [Betaproteobacteria bacterium]